MNRRILSTALLICLSGIALIAFPFADAAPPDSDASPAHNEPHPMPLEKLSIVRGKVANWTTNKGGDADGFKVGENVVVHFPPHHGEQVSAWFKLEDTVTVFAKPKLRPDGTEVMEAVVLQRGEDAMQIPGPKPHHPKKQDGPPPHSKKGPKGYGGPKGHEGEKKEDDDRGKPPHVQIVDELRKIRELLEEQGSR